MIWKLINISIFSLNNFVGVQSAVAWINGDHIFEAGEAVTGLKASREVLAVSVIHISWANIIAGWVASKVDCAAIQGS